jgi:hypothetical protein
LKASRLPETVERLECTLCAKTKRKRTNMACPTCGSEPCVCGPVFDNAATLDAALYTAEVHEAIAYDVYHQHDAAQSESAMVQDVHDALESKD